MKIFNTLSGKKEEFAPGGDVVRMYVCGPTPYDEPHIGHAMSYIIFDVVRRYLEFRGYRVRHVQNYTDIDDKIINRAKQLGTSASELANRFIAEFFEKMDALNIQRAHVYPRVTEEIPSILEVIQGLIAKGHAYQVGGNVYFRVLSLPDYGKLSHRTLDSMVAGSRVDIEENKEHPMDFALWKAAKPGEPAWESPWSPGRPGWHIECSAMSLRHLGNTLDIHGGGHDLIFPHHENEIAQSESYTSQKPFVRYWMHNGWLLTNGEKMSKSLGNVVSIQPVLERYGADALRIFVLRSYYRSPLNYTEEGIASALSGARRLRHAALLDVPARAEGEIDPHSYREKFIQAMDDDFNTAEALAALFELAHQINRGAAAGFHTASAQETLRELSGVLGLSFQPPPSADHLEAVPFIDLLIATRSQLRAAKQWALADQIRDQLKELGVVLEDTPQGTQWRFGDSPKLDK